MIFSAVVSAVAMAKASVCVVGAGPSGLVAIKEHRAVGHEVVCYERSGKIGGE